MHQTTEVFENEEASKFLDYFIAYRKLQDKIEYIKCIAALSSEINPSQKMPKNLSIPLEENDEIQLNTNWQSLIEK